MFDPFFVEWFFNDIEEGIEVPPVGSAGPNGATSIDPELFEAREGADFGFPNPGAVEINDPIGDAHTTIRRVKDERFGESMAAGEESDGHTILWGFNMLRTRGLLSTGQSSKGLGLCSQMFVISIRRNEKIGSMEGRDNCEGEQERSNYHRQMPSKSASKERIHQLSGIRLIV